MSKDITFDMPFQPGDVVRMKYESAIHFAKDIAENIALSRGVRIARTQPGFIAFQINRSGTIRWWNEAHFEKIYLAKTG